MLAMLDKKVLFCGAKKRLKRIEGNKGKQLVK